MHIKVSDEAAEWFKNEYEIEDEISLRFFVRYGGVGGNVPGFSLGVNFDPPTTIHTSVTVNDVLFYIEESDAWYFDGKDLIVSLNHDLDEPQFTYK
ncbi:MAG TPA: hypothetical protein VK085_13905 [Pseudogracilibacillus sp.]|nr:hypothetical protein [Pseudogracilibacillus sp.]